MSAQPLKNLGLSPVPTELKPILGFLQRADELRSQEPIVAYWGTSPHVDTSSEGLIRAFPLSTVSCCAGRDLHESEGTSREGLPVPVAYSPREHEEGDRS